MVPGHDQRSERHVRGPLVLDAHDTHRTRRPHGLDPELEYARDHGHGQRGERRFSFDDHVGPGRDPDARERHRLVPLAVQVSQNELAGQEPLGRGIQQHLDRARPAGAEDLVRAAVQRDPEAGAGRPIVHTRGELHGPLVLVDETNAERPAGRADRLLTEVEGLGHGADEPVDSRNGWVPIAPRPRQHDDGIRSRACREGSLTDADVAWPEQHRDAARLARQESCRSAEVFREHEVGSGGAAHDQVGHSHRVGALVRPLYDAGGAHPAHGQGIEPQAVRIDVELPDRLDVASGASEEGHRDGGDAQRRCSSDSVDSDQAANG